MISEASEITPAPSTYLKVKPTLFNFLHEKPALLTSLSCFLLSSAAPARFISAGRVNGLLQPFKLTLVHSLMILIATLESLPPQPVSSLQLRASSFHRAAQRPQRPEGARRWRAGP